MEIGKLFFDPVKIKNGIPVKFGDATIHVGRAGGQRWLETVFKYQQEIDAIDGDKEKERVVMGKVFADGCIFGWDGFVDNGKPFEYSEDNARRLIESDLIYEGVVAASRNFDAYLREAEERLGESSATKSSGKSRTAKK